MADSIKVNFALDPETVARIEEIARTTYRTKSSVVDWLVAEAWERMQVVARETTTIEAAESQTVS